MKLQKVRLIQLHARIYLRKVRQARKERAQKAILIQAVLRGAAARRRVSAQRHFIRCVVRVQRFYRLRFLLRTRQVATVQKYLRGLIAFRKYRRLAEVRRATTGILE